MALRAYPVGSSAAAGTVPGLNDYDLTRIETNLFTEGVVQGPGDDFAVVQRAAGANLSVDVSAGLALIEITNTNLAHGKTYKTWFESTATVNKTLTTADPTNPRKDRVVLRIDVSTDPDGSSANIAIIEVLAGTPAGSPSAPAVPSNAISLAIIDVPAGDTTITTNQITDDRSYVDLPATVITGLARASDLASTADGKGANLIGVEDAESDFTATTVEGVLHEMQDTIDGIGAALLYDKPVFSSAADSTPLSNPTSATAFDTHTYTIPANDLVAGVWYEVDFIVEATFGTSGQFSPGLSLGGVNVINNNFVALTGTHRFVMRGKYMGTAAAGASVAVRVVLGGTVKQDTGAACGYASSVNAATNGTLAIQFVGAFTTSNAGNSCKCYMSVIRKCSTTGF